MDDKDKKIEKVEDKDPEAYDYKRDSKRTLRDISKDIQDRRKKKLESTPKPEITSAPKAEPAAPAEKKPEEEKPEKVEKVEEPKIDVEAAVKKAADAAAAKATEETKKEFQAKIDEILNKDKDMLEKQKEADELISTWDKEKRLPKDYNELITETMRIADAKMEQKMRAEKAKADEERQTLEKTKADEDAKAKSAQETQLSNYQKQITQDIEELISTKEFKKPTDIEEINNPETKDTAAKEIQKVLEFGVKLNTKLVSEGKQPVQSLYKIYYSHYKPVMDKAAPKDEQPAGADAPIAGANNSVAPEKSGKLGIPYEQLHKESFTQMATRIAREFAKKTQSK